MPVGHYALPGGGNPVVRKQSGPYGDLMKEIRDGQLLQTIHCTGLFIHLAMD